MEIEGAELEEQLEVIRNLPADRIKHFYNQLISNPVNDNSDRPKPLLTSFWSSYNDPERSIGKRCCLLLGLVTEFKMFPREYQLQVTIATIGNRDSLVDVGTGYGKTLCMILPALYAPESISVVISPLKRLQVVQVAAFEKYGLRAIAINEDTPKDVELWAVHVLLRI